MRSLMMMVAAACAVALVGYNNNPVTTYRVQVDQSSIGPGVLPSTCYPSNATPQERDTNPDERAEYVWTLWSNAGTTYLDTGSFNAVKLGAATPVAVTGAIASTDGKTFDGKDNEQNICVGGFVGFCNGTTPPNGYSNSLLLEMNVAFTATGGSPVGTINLTSTYQCTSCNNNDGQVSCGPISLPFSGVSIPVSSLNAYPANVQ